ncbi:MAG: gluconokinase, GntK/IdnK-type [Gordonia sp. (in: high G+C Gram-positive bacteria)]
MSAHRTLGPIIVGGVSGSGKSTVGAALAKRLGVSWADADDLHPAANIAKMSAGIALTDTDRWPWLDRVGCWLAEHDGGAVMSCSVLRRVYRDRLRRAAPTLRVVILELDRSAIIERVSSRQGHFMPVALVDSQLATYEPLAADEPGLSLDARAPVDALVDAIVASLLR